ncbi:hypothetical protein ABZW49_10495 [Nonomuraea wenchangensis]
MREPTHEECTANARVALDDGTEGIACWYPQMGGYTAHALIVPDAGCADVYVWHDGDFPFGGDERPPVELHHCNGTQFVEFGKLLKTFTEDLRER